MFPETYTWEAVLGAIADFLSEPVVATGTIFVIGLSLAPRLVRTLRRAISGR